MNGFHIGYKHIMNPCGVPMSRTLKNHIKKAISMHRKGVMGDILVEFNSMGLDPSSLINRNLDAIMDFRNGKTPKSDFQSFWILPEEEVVLEIKTRFKAEETAVMIIPISELHMEDLWSYDHKIRFAIEEVG